MNRSHTIRLRSWIPTLVALVAASLATAMALAGDGLCVHCRKSAACDKVCRLVKEEKKVTINCWACKEEEFCVPGPSHKACKHTEYVCDEDNPKGLCVVPQKFVWTEWIPSCDTNMFTRKKLMKKTVTKKIPSYKWVVEDVCEKCKESIEVAELPDDAAVPLPPIVDATVLRRE